jgi:hypothetical protein
MLGSQTVITRVVGAKKEVSKSAGSLSNKAKTDDARLRDFIKTKSKKQVSTGNLCLILHFFVRPGPKAKQKSAHGVGIGTTSPGPQLICLVFVPRDVTAKSLALIGEDLASPVASTTAR